MGACLTFHKYDNKYNEFNQTNFLAAHFAKRNTKFGGGRKKLESESEGGQKFLPPTRFLFARPSDWVSKLGIRIFVKESSNFVQKTPPVGKYLCWRALCEGSPTKIFPNWRRERDSNPRYAVKRIHEFQSCSLNHSDISPQLLCCTYLVAVPGWDPARTRNAPKSRAEINLYLLICHLRNWCHPLRANARQGIHGQINRNLAKFFNI